MRCKIMENTNGKMKVMNIRFTPEVYESLKELSEEFDVSMARIVRLALSDNLSKYLGEVRYVDKEQARQINHNICILGRDLRQIGNQLRRIGINYNQELKLKHIEEKNMSDYEKEQARNQVTKDVELLDKDELESLIARYEKATESLGEALWLIHE